MKFNHGHLVNELREAKRRQKRIHSKQQFEVETMVAAIFDFSSVLLILLLLVCTCTYLRELRPTLFDGGQRDPSWPKHKNREGFGGFLWKLSRIGERLSPFVGASCAVMAVYVLLK